MSSILVVEDDRSTRQLLTEMLKTAGFSVASAKDGVDALKRLRAGSDDTPETLLRAVREQAWRYVAKPVEPQAHNKVTAVRSTEWVGDFSRVESTTWRWWTRPGSNR